jgi:hypothetical protein
LQPKLTIGIATRGRPKLAAMTAIETLKNVREKGTQIVILADADDDITGMTPLLPDGVALSIEPREDSVGAKWNRMISRHPADVYMAMVDYSPQTTPGFDTNILKAAELFNDGIGCVYQNLANLSFPAYQCMTAKMAAVMGHFYVEHFPYWFVDHWLDDICRMTGRYVYAAGERTIYERPGNGSTQDFREPPLWATLYDALADEREAIANQLLAACDMTDSQRAILRAQWPLIHQRSTMINSMVRGMEGNAPFDARYERIRNRGIALLQSKYAELKEAA